MVGLRKTHSRWLQVLSHHVSKIRKKCPHSWLGGFRTVWVSEFLRTELWRIRTGCVWNALRTLLCLFNLQGGRDAQTSHILPKASEQPALCKAFPRKLQPRLPTHHHPFPEAAAAQHTHSHRLTGSGEDWTRIRCGIPLDLWVLKYPAYKNQKGFPRSHNPFPVTTENTFWV